MELSSGYPHLHPTAREWADEDGASRVRRIRTDRWIGYARAQAALAAIKDVLSYPKRTRMPNLLLVGPTNNGKTMIVEKFRRSHPPIAAMDAEDGIARVPVLKIQMPAGPDELRFFGAILEGLGMSQWPKERVAAQQSLAVRLMRSTDVRMLIIDELHNVLSGSAAQQRRMLNLLRWLGNELQIPLVGVGTAEALRAIRSDDQLANRFEPLALPVWNEDEAYRRLLNQGSPARVVPVSRSLRVDIRRPVRDHPLRGGALRRYLPHLAQACGDRAAGQRRPALPVPGRRMVSQERRDRR